MLIFPSWTLALDFIFYPIGAILFRSKFSLLATTLLLIGYVLFVFAYHNPDFSINDPSLPRDIFFSSAEPALLAFLLGMIANRYAKQLHLPSGAHVILISLFIIVYCAYFPIGLNALSHMFLVYLAFIFLVHALAKNGFHPFENLLSNWTFAVYLIHLPILTITEIIFTNNKHHAFLITTTVALVTSSIIALILAYYVEGKFIEKHRKAWLNSWQPTHHTPINYSLLSIPVLLFVLASIVFYSQRFLH